MLLSRGWSLSFTVVPTRVLLGACLCFLLPHARPLLMVTSLWDMWRRDLQEKLRQVLLMHYTESELAPRPQFVHHLRPRPLLLSAEALVPEFTKVRCHPSSCLCFVSATVACL